MRCRRIEVVLRVCNKKVSTHQTQLFCLSAEVKDIMRILIAKQKLTYISSIVAHRELSIALQIPSSHPISIIRNSRNMNLGNRYHPKETKKTGNKKQEIRFGPGPNECKSALPADVQVSLAVVCPKRGLPVYVK